MKYNINCIYNYYDTLLSEWGEWNKHILVGSFSNDATNEDGESVLRAGQLNAVDDLAVAGAAAKVAPDGGANLLLRGVGVLVQQRLARHDHAGGAEAALDRAADPEGVHEGFLLKV